MSTTKVRDFTKDHLKEWYFYLSYAQRRGFNVDFMLNHLKDVVRAFIGLQAVAERNICDIKAVQANDLVMLQNELEFLKSRSYRNFVNWGKFIIECLSLAFKLIDKDNVVENIMFSFLFEMVNSCNTIC